MALSWYHTLLHTQAYGQNLEAQLWGLWTGVKKLLTILYFLNKMLVLIPVLYEISTFIVFLLQP